MGVDSAEPPQIQPLQPQNSPTGGAFIPRSGGRNRRKFPEGTAVEVQTNEEDFKGVYFAATVVAPPNPLRKFGRKRSKKLYVEYQNLLAHEDGSDRLREYVNASFVRPVPPLLNTEKGFEPDDVVDAFYKDGWWTGVVARAVDGGERFVVTFHNPPDELEFGISELRAHWDWVNGSWVRPQKQSITGLMFEVGRKVEVSFYREDIQEAWFPATILEDIGNGTFLVEYNIANTDTDSPSTNVKVDSSHIRPCPPLLKDKNFVLLEKVDAFFDLGWWSGVVTKQLENSRYLVFFWNLKCDKEFNQSELRPHMKWKDGKWFASFQPQEPPIPPADDRARQHHTPENSSASVATAPVKSSVDKEDICGGIPRKGHSEPLIPDLNSAHATIPMKKRTKNLSDSEDALSQPRKKLKKGNLVGENKKAMHDGLKKEAICGLASPESTSNTEKSVAQTTLDQSSNHPWEDNVQRKQRNSRTPQSSTASSLGKSSAKNLTVESPEIDVGEKEPDTEGNAKVVTQNGNEKPQTEHPVVIGSPSAKTGSLGGKRRQLSNRKTFISVDDQKQRVGDSTSQKIKDGKRSGNIEGSEKKRKGRLQRHLLESTKTENAENRDISLNRKDDDSQRTCEEVIVGMEASVSNQETANANQENPTTGHEKTANGQFGPGKRKAVMTKRMLTGNHKKENVNESVESGVSHSWKQGRKQISSGKISVKVRDLAGESGDKPGVINHSVESENDPLSKWIEGMHMSSATDGSKLSPTDSAVQCDVNGANQDNGGVRRETNEKQPESEKQSSGLVDRGDVGTTEPQSLPSVDNTVATALDEATQKRSNSGTQTASMPDKVSAVSSEPQRSPSMADTTMVDDSPLIPNQPQSSMEKTIDTVLDKDNEKRTENGMTHSPASVDKVALVPSDPENLPFVKNTILWKTIESMEVFKKMPQKPHFQPLKNLKESSREGVAIGYTVTFSSLVERTSRLHINDPISTIVDIKESLAELEKHGFDIRAIDSCINQLLNVKNVQEKLANDVSTLDNQIAEHDHEKNRIKSDIEKINEQIATLQKKLSLAKSAKEREDEEIAFLQVRRRETKDSIESVRSDFEGIVSSIL